jgi:hypothetical protein
LNRQKDAKITVLVVWEPILATDWLKPGGGVLRRVTDTRAKQIWDREHLMARQLAKDTRRPQPEPECCTRNGILWDLIAVYPPDVVWAESLPTAVFFDGPVLHKGAEVEAVIQKLQPQLTASTTSAAE